MNCAAAAAAALALLLGSLLQLPGHRQCYGLIVVQLPGLALTLLAHYWLLQSPLQTAAGWPIW
jgi:hypothetical protein